ncbi:MAG: glycosyltransferase [Patescibacteria group bacterium]
MKKSPLKIALVHDYLNEFGGAERVLLALSKLYPDAPIYTAFYRAGSPAWERFKHKDVRTSWAQRVPFFASKLHSPLRFLAPQIWNSFDFSGYDVIIGSASWYITKGFAKKDQAKEICYCHTPPRWLYGYPTSIEWQKWWPIRVYGQLIGHFMRLYDFNAAQRVDQFVANSRNVARRIEKFYRRDSQVIYPPVDEFILADDWDKTKKRDDYFLIISRIVGGKGLDLAVKAAVKLGLNLKIAGKPAGYSTEYQELLDLASGGQIEFLGFVPDEELVGLYAHARGFLALASDEDFGITPVEAMMAGTPVVAFNGGGYRESVVDGQTGVLFDDLSETGLIEAIGRFDQIKFDPQKIRQHAQKFSKQRFMREIDELVKKCALHPSH